MATDLFERDALSRNFVKETENTVSHSGKGEEILEKIPLGTLE
ncbi:MAG: hypothetical protein ACWGSD_13345 [Thermodesulfobacteriota bacterium]